MKKCNVLMVVDKSGSMAGTANQTIQGYNEYIQQFKEDAKDMDIRVSMISFNGEVFEHFWDTPANELNELTNKDYKPSGSTAMWDGIGYGLRKIQNTTDVNDENNTYLVIIISDGEENASTHIRQEEVKELISSYEKNTKWTFTFMGCDKKYLMNLAEKIAIPTSNMAVWENQSAGGAVRGMSMARSALRSKLADYKSDNFNSINYYSADNSIADFTDESVNIDVKNNSVDPNVVQSVAPPSVNVMNFMRNNAVSYKANTNSADWSSYEKSWKQD